MLRLLCLMLVSLAAAGCTLFSAQDEASAPGCPAVLIASQLSRHATPDQVTILRGVQDVRCAREGRLLVVDYTISVEIAVPYQPSGTVKLPVALSVAAVDFSGTRVVGREMVRKRLMYHPEDGHRQTGLLTLRTRLPDPERTAKVYVGLVGGALPPQGTVVDRVRDAF
jgi:hypothetical protein